MPLPSKQDFIDEGVRKVDEAIQADAYAGTPSYDLRNAARAILEHIASLGGLEDAPAASAPVAETPPAPEAAPAEATAAVVAEPAAPASGTDPAPEPGG